MQFKKDILTCENVLKNGGLILYPTDTIWGIGCDATNEAAVHKIFTLKQRAGEKTMIILVADETEIYNYVLHPDLKIFNFLRQTDRPTTVIYKNGMNIASGLLSKDGSIAIRITKDDFCTTLIRQFKKPIVSTSANISGSNAPAFFNDISPQIKNGVDYIVQHRQVDLAISKPSAIITLNDAGAIEVIRK